MDEDEKPLPIDPELEEYNFLKEQYNKTKDPEKRYDLLLDIYEIKERFDKCGKIPFTQEEREWTKKRFEELREIISRNLTKILERPHINVSEKEKKTDSNTREEQMQIELPNTNNQVKLAGEKKVRKNIIDGEEWEVLEMFFTDEKSSDEQKDEYLKMLYKEAETEEEKVDLLKQIDIVRKRLKADKKNVRGIRKKAKGDNKEPTMKELEKLKKEIEKEINIGKEKEKKVREEKNKEEENRRIKEQQEKFQKRTYEGKSWAGFKEEEEKSEEWER